MKYIGAHVSAGGGVGAPGTGAPPGAVRVVG
jgi:hypothetical protein